jgi:hypothetical protein
LPKSKYLNELPQAPIQEMIKMEDGILIYVITYGNSQIKATRILFLHESRGIVEFSEKVE